ncbi:beta-hydroxyacyl-ACP dehydratase [Fusobacterium necrophorum subsp. funduliforme]|uniref:3-hydroxyacyl-[acyl-carrier-protein] dehydratase FabZ n=4 Tax=Fusobacterium necrophorum TaxID=859 RepID=A0A4Q2KW87_9FUSO|nr:3-hydroxyacyl-ACP dehydratase FabZ [Fusobacterium necrophorum]EHO20103.1 (3R)-hydroxymyristoyl-[acyl-carrier-protein] dehydratase [Fusobacterium necrophorum subsp. funduliforme 1_1_36S]AVQ21727.1 3-hydroxyacyl-[acyl-carrier-protein] dehydratase FabZ [Fusobacterium necrophorum subsp. funduliforme]AYV93212.1 3-hydroxyacyl-[acyl-carrier-protein] dehydratase FabZ [Fusobacterium necrophorum subsp. funduliforme]AYV95346.1 3-hydroxyacyl-[acyl-carrier-protein] dehydratase FabZ [Fusobacterium necroph
MLNTLEIMERIPHRYPFLLVDRILEMDVENKRVIGRKNVTINEEFFNGHFPGHPIMPGVLIVEGMAQCLGVLVMEGQEGKVPYFAAVESVKFKQPVRPGDTLTYDVKVEKIRSNIVKASGIALVDGVKVAEASFTFCIADK